ncbi:MAG: hypothetical protein FJW26_10905 [Acidimicrobiia bacterium]|nr:hypothetical protein [Acidimicrobiia bacterium]
MPHRTSSTFSGAGQSASVNAYGNRVVRVELVSGQAEIELQRSIDGGTNWVTMTEVSSNAAAIPAGGVSVTTTSGGPCLLRLNDRNHTTNVPYFLELTNVVI